MKKTILMTFIVALLGVGSVWAKQGHSPEKKLERLTETLQLDESQKNQLAELMKVHHSKIKQIREENKMAIEMVLTDQQRQKFSQMHEKRKSKRQNRSE